MGLFGDKDKGKSKTPNKFAGRRQYKIRNGLPEKTLERIIDLHELLQCDPDDHGYVMTTFKEMHELTEMDLPILSIMINNGMIRKLNTGGSPKFKYKWDTIKPSLDMAVKLINTKYENANPASPDNVVSESKPESIMAEEEIKEEPEIENFEDMPPKPDVVLDSLVTGDIMTMHINISKLKITESQVLNAILNIQKSN